MKKNFLSAFVFHYIGIGILSLLFSCFSFQLQAQNLIPNGNFEAGNVGFKSNYQFVAAGGIGSGQYAIRSNPNTANPTFFGACPDKTSGTGLMMVVDGGSNSQVWQAGVNGGGVQVPKTGTYTFSFWVANVNNNNPNANRAQLRLQWNNVSNIQFIQGGDLFAPNTTCTWKRIAFTFTANANAWVQIEMFNDNGSAAENDFALDDFELYGPPDPIGLSHTVTNPLCPGGTDGVIAAYGTGGVPPYSYALTGASTANNTTGIFTNLAPGTYSVTVTDSQNPAQSITTNNITVSASPNPLSITTNPATAPFCSGSPIQLTASGSNNYTWTAVPATTITNANTATATASPTQNTVFTVSTNIPTSANELIYNGDFSLGNVGFGSDYTFNNNNSNGARRVYGVVAAGNSFFNGFAGCTGRGGTGNFFIADGSDFSDGISTRVWFQTVPVRPNTTYTFSYFAANMTANNPAQLQVRINGNNLTGPSANPFTIPAGTCVWNSVSYTWNSGSNTTATIAIYNLNNLSNGNDLGLDDISMQATTSPTCTVTRDVSITITPSGTPTTGISYNPTSVCVGGSNPTLVKVANFTEGGTYTASPAGLSINASTGAIDVAASTPGAYTITYAVAASGCGLAGSSQASFTINALPATPAGSVTTQPNCTVTTGTITLTSPLGVNFEYSRDGGVTYQPSAVFTGLASGSYNITTRNTSTGCISAALNLVVNAVPGAPATPTASVTVQPTCTVPTGTIVVTNPTGATLEYSINGTTYQSGTTFSSLAPGNYTVTVRNTSNGCVSNGLNLTVNTVPAPPATPTASVTVQPTCTVPT
ncbi:MAG: hypothetical protein ACOVNR_07825, partial [Chitinophagaceae bacterium]